MLTRRDYSRGLCLVLALSFGAAWPVQAQTGLSPSQLHERQRNSELDMEQRLDRLAEDQWQREFSRGTERSFDALRLEQKLKDLEASILQKLKAREAIIMERLDLLEWRQALDREQACIERHRNDPDPRPLEALCPPARRK